ncbi:polygalacturonase-like [Telopea speciosissima]|uniref:polygalacturonase-like n=1 Tax=Telopea speciosissima TaxID=54955 RepID=UPI001CC37C8E|nr:polygalacturonase-like [Telopea speciosissima]
MAKQVAGLRSLLLLLLIICFPSSQAAYNVVSFGAKPDGQTDATQAFLNAWASACNSAKPVTIYVPNGRYLLKPAVFGGPCKSRITILMMSGTTLVAPSDYRVIGNSGNWLLFNKVVDLIIYGGTIDAQGHSYWACKRTAGNSCPGGARSMTFNYGRNIVIKGLTSINSQVSHIVFDGCTNALVQGVKIIAPAKSPNTDGIHVQYSTGITIVGSTIRTGDDCISIGPGSTNLWIDRLKCGPGHGVSIGSLGKDMYEQGVQNVTVMNSVFRNTENGVRIKSWAKASYGFVRGVMYSNIIMRNVQNPIIIDQKYCPDYYGCPNQNSGVKVSQVIYKDIRGSSATQVAIKFECSSTNPCSGIKLQGVRLTYLNRPAQTSCNNAGGTATGSTMSGRCL